MTTASKEIQDYIYLLPIGEDRRAELSNRIGAYALDECNEREQKIEDILAPILPRMPDNAVHAAEMAVEFAQEVSRDLERDSRILRAVREAVKITADEDSSAGVCWNAAMQKVTDAMTLDR